MRKLIVKALIATTAVMITAMTASASPINAGVSMAGSFSPDWTIGSPDVTTATSLVFSPGATGFTLDPATASGDLAWNGGGSQPDYTMDPSASNTRYAGVIGGASGSLAVGDRPFDPDSDGRDFINWLVDVPGTSSTDTLHFDLVSETVFNSCTSGNNKYLGIYLLGNTWDDDFHWMPTVSSLILTVVETDYLVSQPTYVWNARWSAPQDRQPAMTPEPSTVVLLGFGLCLMIVTVGLKSRNAVVRA